MRDAIMPKQIVGFRRPTAKELQRAEERHRQARTIDFCTWAWGRAGQLAQALPRNLATTKGLPVEFHLLVVEPQPDGDLNAFLRTVRDRRLHVHREEWPVERRHFARMYNAAHRYGTGRVVVTLDADNIVGPKFCVACWRLVTPTSFLWGFSGDWGDGTCGRLAFDRATFWDALGGYDQALPGRVAYQDVDIVQRAKALGLRCHRVADRRIVGVALPNGKDATGAVVNLDVDGYRAANAMNRQRSKANLAAGRLVANIEP